MMADVAATRRSDRPGRRWGDGVCLACFFISGFAGLSYEICWIRQASLVFGATSFAVSTVVAVFFAGLALGSIVFGRFTRRMVRPLRSYALLEVGVGVLVLLTPAAFSLADVLFGWFYRALADHFALLSVCRVLLVAVMLLPTTFLMGGTLPLFCRHYVGGEGRIALPVGILYGWNTLGAALGCAAGGFVLLPLFGLRTTIFFGAGLNLGIGAAVWIAARHRCVSTAVDATSDPDAAPRPAPAGLSGAACPPALRHRPDLTVWYALFGLSGLVALGSEVLWTRFCRCWFVTACTPIR